MRTGGGKLFYFTDKNAVLYNMVHWFSQLDGIHQEKKLLIIFLNLLVKKVFHKIIISCKFAF